MIFNYMTIQKKLRKRSIEKNHEQNNKSNIVFEDGFKLYILNVFPIPCLTVIM